MFIEELIIDGFKSYATRTVLSGFDPHFNAITGLNGSGKSNILDSICFVLGISNLSQVRVGNLQELVYKQGQAGVTKASVTLVFNNEDKKGSPVGYEHFDQITITRQVVIGGKNKYLINGHTAQASQVQNLFHSVQLNVNNPHFLIMQGRITKVLNMKPPEILGMIEEAAGTRMYETKKQSALKTMEKKQAKVDEINAILADEITPTLERLRSERAHYLKWSANAAEAERLERFCVAHGFAEAQATAARSDEEVAGMRAAAEELAEGVAALDAEVQEKEAAAAELLQRREAQAEGAYKKAAKAEEALSKELVKASSEYANKKAALKDEERALAALEESQAEGGAAEAAKEQELERCRAAIAAAEATAAARSAAHKALQTDYQNMCAGVAAAADGGSGGGGAEALTLTGQIAAAAAEAADAAAREEQSALRAQHLGATAKATQKELKAAEKEVAKLRREHAAADGAAAAARAAVAALAYDADAAAAAAAEAEAAEGALGDARAAAEALSAQLAGRLAFEYTAPHRGFDHAKVRGLVARLVSVRDAAAATALEVTAGGKLYQVVVDDDATGKALLQGGRLRRRVTIVPLNRIAHRTLEAQRVERAAAVARRCGGSAVPAIELVGYADDVAAAAEYAFGTTLVCDALETARAVAFDRGVRARTVTLEGDTFEPQGTLTGGSKAQLGTVLAKLHQLSAANTEAGRLEERVRALAAAAAAMAAAAAEHARLSQALALAEEKAEILGRRLGESTAAQLEARLADVSAQIQEAEAAAAEARRARATATARHEQLRAEESVYRERREAALAGLEKGVGAARAAAAAATAALKKETQRLQVLEREAEQLRADGGGVAQAIEGAQRAIAAARAAADALGAAVAAKKGAYEAARAALGELRGELGTLEARAKEARREGERAGKRRDAAALELKKAQHRLAKCGRDGDAAAKHVAAMLRKHPWIAAERAFFGRAGTDYDFAACDTDGAHRRLKALQAEQAALGKKINKKVMGMIEKAEAEYQELMHKKHVIEADKSKIHSVIAELDQKKNQALQTTWVKVNRDFGSIFSTLLPGTSAKLEPPEGGTALDGLEVKVAFGSVWKESLTELSGGQRSLLALSLILSLLLFKPAPMYILDEVDAALDLSHTQNIGAMLRTHFSHSQFVVVSLKEGMFNNANVIFTTKFVDGVSAVNRAVLSSDGGAAQRRGNGAATAAKGGRKRSKGDENNAGVRA